MSLICRPSYRLLNCVQACNVNSIAYYSRGNRSRDADGHSHSVPRWQYFDGTEKRFFLPGSLGPSWQVQRNVKDVCLSEMVDCYNRSNDRLHIKMFECPLLLYSEVFSTFPGHGPMNPELTSIKLSYKHIEDEEKGQKFVHIASKVIAQRLTLEGYWTDFINIYTGKPEYDLGKSGHKMDHDFVIKRQTIGLNQPQTFVFIKEKEKCNKHCIIYTDAALSFVEETIYDI